jgi:hypothetical protein
MQIKYFYQDYFNHDINSKKNIINVTYFVRKDSFVDVNGVHGQGIVSFCYNPSLLHLFHL